jgi:beta-glucosidase
MPRPPGDLDIIATPLDALGVNYYHGEFVGGAPDPHAPASGDAPRRDGRVPFPSHEGIYWHDRGLPRTNMHWEVSPRG